jgi:hypothetical protein
MSQIDEKAKRVKYLRALEKFAKFAVGALKREDFNEAAFYERADKNAQILKKIEPVFLDQPYTKALENFVNQILARCARDELVRAANGLDRLRNQKTYKKEKHKKNYKDEA